MSNGQYRYISSKERKIEKAERFVSGFLTLLFCLALAGMFVITTESLFFSYAYISGDSMYPSYTDGQKVRTDKDVDKSGLRRGDIIAFKSPLHDHSEYIKRITGIPGDTVMIADGYLYVNGERADDGFPVMEDADYEYGSEPLTLEDGEYFVLGDNRNRSADSRMFGPVTADMITALVTTPPKTE